MPNKTTAAGLSWTARVVTTRCWSDLRRDAVGERHRYAVYRSGTHYGNCWALDIADLDDNPVHASWHPAPDKAMSVAQAFENSTHCGGWRLVRATHAVYGGGSFSY